MGQKNDFGSKFLSINLTRLTKSGTIGKTPSPLKNQFWRYAGVFRPFLRGREAKNARNSRVAGE